MENNLPHIMVGQIVSDPFLPSERSKTKEHSYRLRSDFYGNQENKNLQKSTKNEE